MNYNQYELLNIFGTKKIIDADAEIIEFTVQKDDLVLSLYVSAYEDYCALTLNHLKYKLYIVDIGMSDIIDLKVLRRENDLIELKFYKESIENPIISVIVKPHITIDSVISNH